MWIVYLLLLPLCNEFYYTTQAVRGPITKISQSKCSIPGPIFPKYRTGHCPEWSRTCVSAFFSCVINLLLTKLARDRTGRISARGLDSMDRTQRGLYKKDLGQIFSQYGPHAWLIRCMYARLQENWFKLCFSVFLTVSEF